jgi:hypothetical protein
VGGACGVRPLVVRSWPGEQSGISTPKHAAQRTDEARSVASAVSRMNMGKMARVIFMASSIVSRSDLIAFDSVNPADFEHYSYQLCPLTYLMFSRTPPEFGVFSFELPPDEFSLGACSVRALTCMKAK